MTAAPRRSSAARAVDLPEPSPPVSPMKGTKLATGPGSRGRSVLRRGLGGSLCPRPRRGGTLAGGPRGSLRCRSLSRGRLCCRLGGCLNCGSLNCGRLSCGNLFGDGFGENLSCRNLFGDGFGENLSCGSLCDGLGDGLRLRRSLGGLGDGDGRAGLGGLCGLGLALRGGVAAILLALWLAGAGDGKDLVLDALGGERQAPALGVDLEDLHANLIARMDDLARALHMVGSKLGDVHEPLDAVEDLDEGTEGDDLGDLARELVADVVGVDDPLPGVFLGLLEAQ